MEELKKVSPENKHAFKKHYHQLHQALEKLQAQKSRSIPIVHGLKLKK
jgi:hypothetical protein